MATAIRPVPPPPPSEPGEPRRPGLAKSGLLPHRLRGRDVVQAWRNRRHVSDRDVRAVLCGAPQSRVDDMSRGDASYPIDLLFALPERDALELIRDLEDAVRVGRDRRSA